MKFLENNFFWFLFGGCLLWGAASFFEKFRPIDSKKGNEKKCE